jgi:hypothetical protein
MTNASKYPYLFKILIAINAKTAVKLPVNFMDFATLPIVAYIAPKCMITNYDELERIWKEFIFKFAWRN